MAGRHRRRRRIGRKRRGERVRELSNRSEPSLAQRVSHSARLGRRQAGLERLRPQRAVGICVPDPGPAFLVRPAAREGRAGLEQQGLDDLDLRVHDPDQLKLKLDLDLKIFDKNGTQVGYSGSWDNSYEVAEFDATPGETYQVRIRRWSGTDWTWYGLAWTVTGSLLDLGSIVATGETRLARIADDLPHLSEG